MCRSAVVAAVAVLVFAAPSASALPRPASGSNCSSDWVNNAGAMACFTNGEEETHAGAPHPHYVACLNGEVYCCVDDSRGQNCESVAKATRATSKDWIKAIQAAQRARAAKMSPAPGDKRPVRAP